MLKESMTVLQVADVKKSESFYCDKLGFKSNGTWGEGPDFCIVRRNNVSIALDRSRSNNPIPTNQYWAVYVYVDDSDALCKEFQSKGIEIFRGPENADYGLRDFDIRDPDGHIIAFGHELDS